MKRTKPVLKASKDGKIRTMLDYQLALAFSVRPEISEMYIHREDPYMTDINHGNRNISNAFKTILDESINKVWEWARQNPQQAMSTVKLSRQHKPKGGLLL